MGGFSTRGSVSGPQSDLRKRRKVASEVKNWKDQNALEQKRASFREVDSDSITNSEASPVSYSTQITRAKALRDSLSLTNY